MQSDSKPCQNSTKKGQTDEFFWRVIAKCNLIKDFVLACKHFSLRKASKKLESIKNFAQQSFPNREEFLFIYCIILMKDFLKTNKNVCRCQARRKSNAHKINPLKRSQWEKQRRKSLHFIHEKKFFRKSLKHQQQHFRAFDLFTTFISSSRVLHIPDT